MWKSDDKHKSPERGFTLLEILLVVAAIGILAGIVILAINPGRQLAAARNAQRQSDVNTILNALYQYMLDNRGVIPSTIPTLAVGGSCVASSSDIDHSLCKEAGCSGADLVAELTTDGTYLPAMPSDPSGYVATDGETIHSGYFIAREINGRITVCAPSAENDAVISVTR